MAARWTLHSTSRSRLRGAASSSDLCSFLCPRRFPPSIWNSRYWQGQPAPVPDPLTSSTPQRTRSLPYTLLSSLAMHIMALGFKSKHSEWEWEVLQVRSQHLTWSHSLWSARLATVAIRRVHDICCQEHWEDLNSMISFTPPQGNIQQVIIIVPTSQRKFGTRNLFNTTLLLRSSHVCQQKTLGNATPMAPAN